MGNPVFDFDYLRDPEDGFGVPCRVGGGGMGQKQSEIEIVSEKRVFPVRLGKFRSTSNEGHGRCGEKERDVGETSSSSLDARRCYSMGSYQYVVADSTLQVALCPNRASNGGGGGAELKILTGRDGHNRNSTTTIVDAEARKISARSKNESLSVSKIWLWSKKGKFPNSSNTDFSGIPVDLSLPWTNRGQGT